jgi:hypothetical protein
MNPKKLHLEELKFDQLSQLATFIVTENFKHHANEEMPENFEEDIFSIYEEEKRYFMNSQIFVAKDDLNSLVGAIRVLKWNYVDQLPIEKIFGIDPLTVDPLNELRPIWHIGRFATKKKCADFNLFKKLMVSAIAPICQNKKSIAFAEIDSKLLRVMNIMGIKTKVVGKSINYLGSETIPVAMDYHGLIDFYNRNSVLLPTKEQVTQQDTYMYSMTQNAKNINTTL